MFYLSQKLFDFPPNVSFWQGFLDEVNSFKEQTKSLTREELITLTEDVQSGKIGFGVAQEDSFFIIIFFFNYSNRKSECGRS